MSILLIAATVLSFLAGGVLREDAFESLVVSLSGFLYRHTHDFLKIDTYVEFARSYNRIITVVLTSVVGLLQSMPFIFLTFFELVYLPDRIKHPEKYEGYIRTSIEDQEELEDTIAEEMSETSEEIEEKTNLSK